MIDVLLARTSFNNDMHGLQLNYTLEKVFYLSALIMARLFITENSSHIEDRPVLIKKYILQ